MLSTKPRTFRSRDLPLVMRLLEAGNDEFQIAHVLEISVETLFQAARQNKALREALDSRDEIRLWDERKNMSIAHQLSARGYSEIELVEAFGASPKTIRFWKRKYPDFDAALQMSEEMRIQVVERTLFEVTTGYVVEESKILNTKAGLKKVRERKNVPPSRQDFYLSSNNASKYGTLPRSGRPVEDDPLDGLSELLSRGFGQVMPVEKDAG